MAVRLGQLQLTCLIATENVVTRKIYHHVYAVTAVCVAESGKVGGMTTIYMSKDIAMYKMILT